MTVPQSFFALIKDDNGVCQIKRIRVNQALQTELAQVFEDQRVAFEQGVDTEVTFNGDWKPESNEVLTLLDIAESQLMSSAFTANATSFTDLDLSNFSNEPIKALFTGINVYGVIKVFVQKFSSGQVLSRNSLPIIQMQTGNTFVKVTSEMFTIDNKLVAVIEGNKTKFKSFHNARMVFDLTDFYKEATDDDLTNIAQHASLDIPDVVRFIEHADSQVRKMVHLIQRNAVLDSYTVAQISTAAANFPNVPIVLNNGKITLPNDKKELKDILHFLLEDIYKGPLSGSSYLTNSKRVR